MEDENSEIIVSAESDGLKDDPTELAKDDEVTPFLTTYKLFDNGTIVCGTSLIGRAHQQFGEVCQDYHLFSDLGNDWHLYIISDGAGSASASNRGSRWNCVIAEYLFKGLLERVDWKNRKELPSELEWYQEFTSICRMVKSTIEERVETLDEPLRPKDFNATLLVLIVTPLGMMSAHIGDGRMGYQDENGDWYSLMTPHKGREANQTIFIMNNWDAIKIPALKINGVSVPEVRVLHVLPRSVIMMTDGCENFSWNCIQLNSETNRYEDVNTPFAGFCNPLVKSVMENGEENRINDFVRFVDSNTDACKNEQDDRSLLLGIYQRGTNEKV